MQSYPSMDSGKKINEEAEHHFCTVLRNKAEETQILGENLREMRKAKILLGTCNQKIRDL